MNFSKLWIGVGFGAALALGGASPTFADDVTDRLKSCRVLGDTTARAQCYDRIVDGLPTAGPIARPQSVPTPAITPPAAPAPTAAANPTDRFGEKDLSMRQRVPENELPPDELRARVTTAKFDASGYATLTLENGQVWRQMEASSLRISKGNAVKIRSGTLGVFYLSLESGNRSFRVKRLK